MSLLAVTGALANESTQQDNEEDVYESGLVIQEWNKDITGDNHPDSIKLKGVLFPDSSLFYQTVWADIKSYNGEEFRIVYESGYSPTLTFEDLNHDGIVDLFYSSATGGSGGLYHYDLHTLANQKLKNLQVPPPVKVEARFENDYKALIILEDSEKSYTIDLSSRKKDYERIGLYNDGKLVEPTKLMVKPYGLLEPSNVNGKKGLGLHGIQGVSGAYNADGIGSTESYWYYEDHKWKLIDAQFSTNP
ncbi:hypothetical protein Q75_07390 [Bacillus coahuilensis p1.1.43]|uniref:Spore coat protein n=1 Tax=Bacillus coahuilensis p1.1.43 TaxID=1150625 RepID=A0A147K953_9BACI|nr:hypothetical protein [Bacillus coahuilensis]KUP06769.1 hypothetical protein Q75_07390 [Bacillus coahuilensis p1.1.43]